MNKPDETKKTSKGVREIAVLGSTGSIGTQTLDIIEEYPWRLRASVLTAGSNWRLLASQARKFLPRLVVIADTASYRQLADALADLPIQVAAGPDAIAQAAAEPYVDMVITAMVGYSGLLPTIAAVKEGKTIGLANKETLVVAGDLINRLVKEHGAQIIPVDSEHSAIFQCLQGETTAQARKIILTASGGPFRTLSPEQLENVTVADALRNPNWSMGAKVTIDSASMMNKGFEVIEAHHLFGCPPSCIEVAVHPQSIVHSMVEFNDGSVKAQLAVPDMHLPIRYALGWPDRLETPHTPLTLSHYRNLTFEEPDIQKFPLLQLAFDAIGMGGNMPCVLNAANEIAVDAFLKGITKFTNMPRIAAHVMANAQFIASPSLDDLVETNRLAREAAINCLND